jgi:hypothetical protein
MLVAVGVLISIARLGGPASEYDEIEETDLRNAQFA